MLIEFSVGNYRSFKDKVTFSMVAADIVSKDKNIDQNNVFAVDNELKLLKSAGIYGANASGKSNLAKALSFMQFFIISSSKETQITDKIDAEPFRLSVETEGKPSYFELVFLMDGQKYRYGFEVTKERVISEWLFYVPKLRETNLFERKLDKFKISKTYKAAALKKRTRKNALFLSVSAQFNVEIANNILEDLYIKSSIIFYGLDDEHYLSFTIDCLRKYSNNREDIIDLIKKLDLGISDIKIDYQNTGDFLPEQMPDKFKDFIIKTWANPASSIIVYRQKFDIDGNSNLVEEFNLENHESEGTRKVIALAGILINTLKEGYILMIDEFDNKLHPLISLAIVKLFNSKETNPNNAQLIFITHDTNLLDNKVLRRDQIWFTEKNRYGATDLYSLAEYKITDDAPFESDYIKGRYGAIPYIGNLNSLLDSNA